MAKNQKTKKKQVVELTPAEKFAQLQTLKKATRCMLVDQDVYDVYVKLTKDFADLGEKGKDTPFEGWEQCAGLSEECARLAEEWKKEHSLGREIESRTVTTSVKDNQKKNTGKVGRWIVLAVVMLIAGVIVCYHVDSTRYQIAKLEQKLGFEEEAKSSFEKLGEYKDCASKVLEIQKKMIRTTPKGRSVDFGTIKTVTAKGEQKEQDCEWIVLDRQGDQVLLTKRAAINDVPYNDSSQEVTWEKCTLRKYLNSTFIDQTFTQEEQGIIGITQVQCQDNETYGTEGGSNTADKVFIMNEQEVRQYRKKLGIKLKTMRLRTPGKDQTTTTYVSALGQTGDGKKAVDIIDYGFPVERNGACIRPTMWVDCK